MAKPADVTDIDTWLYNHKKANIVLGAEGSMLVLDPKTRDVSKPVKTIPFRRGIDAFRVLAQPSMYGEELRATALEKTDTIIAARQDALNVRYTAVVEADQHYLEAVDKWEAAKTVANALSVAETQKTLAKSEEEYRKTLYPHRDIKELSLLRKDVDYRTKDDRALPFLTALETYDTTTSVERVLPIVADKA
jgi:hypothetical protein